MNSKRTVEDNQIRKIRRLTQLLEYLQSGHKYNCGLLSSIFSVSRRTVYRDIRLLKEGGVPIEYDEVLKEYRLPRNWTLPRDSLTRTELGALCALVANAEKSFLCSTISIEARRALTKIEQRTSQEVVDGANQFARRTEFPVPIPAHSDAEELSFKRIANSMAHGLSVRISFKQEDGTIQQTLFSPYWLRCNRTRWVATGRSSYHRKRIEVAIPDIVTSEPTEHSFKMPPRS